MEPATQLKKSDKFFLPPPKDGSDFKELFARIAAAGAGRPADKDGFPAGPWTPELLAEAISQIDGNRGGVDLRTVQLWFQANDKGISTTNIRWLARVLGCDDPVATREWQMELSTAQSRLTAKRRKQTSGEGHGASEHTDTAPPETLSDEKVPPAETSRENTRAGSLRRFSLATRSEALFSSGSLLDLPAAVFAGAVALGFFSYVVDIHSVFYEHPNEPTKQVGFLWAPNWTILFLVILPLYLIFAGELIAYWKEEGRARFTLGREDQCNHGWMRSVEAYSFSYWASLVICLPVASVTQWINECLVPLLMSDPGNFGVDWGRIAIFRPEVISLPEAIVFTGAAYLYMGACFFVFFAGLILLFTLAHDLAKIRQTPEIWSNLESRNELLEACVRVMHGIFRCTVLGLLIAICMRLQNMFMLSRAETILTWLVDDLRSLVSGQQAMIDRLSYSRPTLYSSLLVVLTTCTVFLHGAARVRWVFVQTKADNAADGLNGKRLDDCSSQPGLAWARMFGVVGLLVANYLLIDVFTGFSVLLSLGGLLATYSLIDPGFRLGR
jgi:hypothetical protein